MEGPDHAASTTPDDFTAMVQKIRHIEAALGNGIKLPSKKEIEISQVVLKKIVAAQNIAKGEIFTANNVSVKRSDSGLSASLWDSVIGLKAGKDFRIGEGITW